MQYSLPLLPLKLHRAVAPTVSVRRICTSEALVGLKLRGIRELFVLSVPVTVCSSIVALRAIDTGSLAAIEKWLRVYIVVVVLAEATAHAFGLVEKTAVESLVPRQLLSPRGQAKSDLLADVAFSFLLVLRPFKFTTHIVHAQFAFSLLSPLSPQSITLLHCHRFFTRFGTSLVPLPLFLPFRLAVFLGISPHSGVLITAAATAVFAFRFHHPCGPVVTPTFGQVARRTVIGEGTVVSIDAVAGASNDARASHSSCRSDVAKLLLLLVFLLCFELLRDLRPRFKLLAGLKKVLGST